MVAAVEQRFGRVNRLPRPIEWLSDNGSPYVARDTRTFARDIGLLPKTTPLESPQSTDEFEQPLFAFRANFLLRMGDRVAKSGAWRRKPRRAAYGRSSFAASMRARRGPVGCHPLVTRSYAASPSAA